MTRLIKTINVKCRVVESDVSTLVIGRKVYGYLLERKAEELEFALGGDIDHDGIKLRLDEMSDTPRAEGMSTKGLT